MKKLPPLNWLRSFEASARHLNFTHAANELSLTQAAISKQIRNLEYSLGTDLFIRLPRGLQLSEDGAAYLPAVKESIAKLADVTNELFGGDHAKLLNLRCSLVFFNCCLVQLLPEFRAAHPDIDFRLSSEVWVNDGDIDPSVDMEIRYGFGQWPNLVADRLSRDRLIPVCSPDLLKNRPIESLEDLVNHELLHVLGYSDGWSNWLSAMPSGSKVINASQGMQFDTLLSAFSAAEHGMGVVLARSSLVEHYIEQGRLVAPLEESLAVEEAFYLVYRAGKCDAGANRVFRDWLVSKTAS